MKTLIFYLLIIPNVITSQWNYISSVNSTNIKLLKFFDENNGYVGGEYGLWRTSNSGVNWVHVYSDHNINSFSFINLNTGIIVGDSGFICKTTDGGNNWNLLNTGVANNFNSISYSTSSYVYIVGQNGIFLRSFNSGNTWTNNFIFNRSLYYINISPSGTGFTLGADNCEYFSETANGGTNWLGILNISNSYPLKAGELLFGQTLVCVGEKGRIRKTTNFGLTWIIPNTNTNLNLNFVDFVDSNIGWICGDSGTILKSTNSGSNWYAQNISTVTDLCCLSFTNSLTGWISSKNGYIFKTTTGGITSIGNNSCLTKNFDLVGNYPNPFNPMTKIKYTLSKRQWIRLRIYDINGKNISTLVNGIVSAGEHEVIFDAGNHSSGIYFCSLQNKTDKIFLKIILIK